MVDSIYVNIGIRPFQQPVVMWSGMRKDRPREDKRGLRDYRRRHHKLWEAAALDPG